MNLGTISLNGDTPGFVGADESTGDINMAVRDDIIWPLVLTVATNESLDFGYQEAGNAMVVPAGQGSYTIDINFEQKFGNGDPERVESFKYENKVITPRDVVITDGTVTSFEKGKQYRVYITVYGLEEVVVNVQLVPWEDAGTITIDPDQKEDGIMQQVNATVTIDENNKNCVLYAETFEEGNDIFCMIGTDFTLAPIGVYTLTEESKIDTGIQSIEVTEVGKIASVAR